MQKLSKYLIFSVATLLQCLFFIFAAAQTPIAPTTWTGSPASAAGPSAFTTLPATVTPGAGTVAVSQWNRGATVFNAAAACYNSRDWEVGGSLASAVINNKCIFFTITNSASTELQITRMFIRSQVSATGPQFVQMQYTLGSTTANFGTTQTTVHDATPEDWTLTGNMCIGPGQTATFRLYGWGATGLAGTLRINDGTAVIANFADPVLATATSNAPICQGNTLELYGSATGGIPGYSYSWTGPGGFTSTDEDPVITGAPISAAGIYTLVVTDILSCSNTASPATTTVIVNAAPSAITGVLSVCPLLTTTLSSATVGGTWSSSDIAIANVASSTGVVTGIAPGTATITYQLGSSCFTTAVVTVAVPPDPISGPSDVCEGQSIIISSSPLGGAWSSSNTAVATVGAGTGVVSGVAAGTSIITYSVPTGCIATSTVTVYAFPTAISGTAVVCVGQTTSLTSSPIGGTWSSASASIATVDAAGTVTGVGAGTTTITYTLPGGCSVLRTITVNGLPSITTAPTDVCVGSVAAMSAAPGGGTWTSSNPTVATVGASTGNVVGVAAGTSTITYTLPSSCFNVTTITVNPLPAAITGATNVCVGATTSLSSPSAGGTWSSSNIAVGTISALSGTIGGITAGTTRITYTFTTTGCFTTRVQTINPLPTAITGPTVVCPGLTVTLSSSPTGGAWSSDNVAIATVAATTGVVTGVSAGIANITYTLPTGCAANRTISVNPAPPATITPLSDTTFCPGGFVVLTSNTGIGLAYQWFSGTTPIPGATTSLHTASSSASYRVRITNSLGCPTFSIPMTILVDTVIADIAVTGGTTTGCAATGVTLNALPSSGFTYQWLFGSSPISAGTSASWVATATGSYAAIVMNATGCADTSAFVAVTILPSPDVTLTASGPLTFCSGGSVTLSVPTAAGNTYQWFEGTTAIAGATSSVYVAMTTGNYYVQVANLSGCSSSSIIAAVIAEPLPSATISTGGPTVFCGGGSVTLTVSSGVGLSYQWYNGATAILGATNATYVATLSGIYRVRVTNIVTACSALTASPTTINVVDAVTTIALTPERFCWGGSALLTTSASSLGTSISYQWLRNGVVIPGATSPTYSADEAGNYSCNIAVPGSCTLATTTISVTEFPLPNPVVNKSGSVLSTGNFYITYQWYKDLLPITGATNSTYVALVNGNYKVRVTDTNGCQSVSSSYILTGVSTTSALQTNIVNEAPVVYPNPTTGMVYISTPVEVTSELYSIDGKLLSKGNIEINMQSFSPGVYLLKVISREGQLLLAQRIIKQ